MSSKKKVAGAPRSKTQQKRQQEAPATAGDFDSLVSSIVHIHQQTQEFAAKAVNVALTLRNWLIGQRIEVYERQGADRATYGGKWMDTLAKRLVKQGWERCDRRELYRFRQFYLAYPKIVESLTPQSRLRSELGPLLALIPSVPARIRESVTPKSHIVESVTPPSLPEHPELLQRLSFTHLAELIQLPDDTQRRFYEIECIRGNWSVRELRRQIASLYYQRSGLSKDKAKLSTLAHEAAETLKPAHIIRDPYVFEFLGLRSRDVMAESDLEDALLDRLQDFLLELGHGFCFEARQKRVLIGDEHFFIDLVFYHRVLKCHILVELKTDAFQHEHLGQLNTYVAYYKKHQMTAGDQPPIGILLCTRKNDALVEFALGDLSNKVFVSRYAVELPKKEEMERFIAQLTQEAGQ
jgi:predicted nuclease of restriction endonuclease-like (RecB) superfamily